MNTTNFNEHASQFEIQLSKAFNKIWDHILEDKNSNWTRAVMSILSTESRKLGEGIKVAASRVETADCTEWLYDFVCYENNEKGPFNDIISLKDVKLVVESEWRSPFTNDYLQDIQDDFEKLILARSEYRLMIFEGDAVEEVTGFISHLISVVKNCKLTRRGDRYLFAGWIKSSEFYYDLYVHP